MQQSKLPLISVGMPLYNEERFIEESLISLLAQDYQNIEIIISDNTSTDRTSEICRHFAAKDSRISFHQFSENKGVTQNFQYVLDQASGKYFMWASGHDLWSPNSVSECTELLNKNPEAAIAIGSSTWIDYNGDLLPKTSGWTDTRGMSPVARFFSVFWGNMHPVLGLVRTEYLKEAGPINSFAGTDLVLLSKLVLKGNFLHATQASWKRREFRKEVKHTDKLKRYRSLEYGLSHSLLDRYFPLIKLPVALVSTVLQSELSITEKMGILIALIPAFPVRYLIGKN